MSIPVGPDMTPEPIAYSDEQLRAIYARIERINQHFEACCAFQMDRCHWGDEYGDLYGHLIMAGLPDHKSPCSRETFEAWLGERPDSSAS